MRTPRSEVGVSNRTFIVLEKDDDLRSLYRRKLDRKFRGCTVIESASCAEALDSLAHATVDAIIVNQAALDARGSEILHIIRRVNADVPIVSIGDALFEHEAIGCGADIFVDAARWEDLGSAVEQALIQRSRLIN